MPAEAGEVTRTLDVISEAEAEVEVEVEEVGQFFAVEGEWALGVRLLSVGVAEVVMRALGWICEDYDSFYIFYTTTNKY